MSSRLGTYSGVENTIYPLWQRATPTAHETFSLDPYWAAIADRNRGRIDRATAYLQHPRRQLLPANVPFPPRNAPVWNPDVAESSRFRLSAGVIQLPVNVSAIEVTPGNGVDLESAMELIEMGVISDEGDVRVYSFEGVEQGRTVYGPGGATLNVAVVNTGSREVKKVMEKKVVRSFKPQLTLREREMEEARRIKERKERRALKVKSAEIAAKSTEIKEAEESWAEELRDFE